MVQIEEKEVYQGYLSDIPDEDWVEDNEDSDGDEEQAVLTPPPQKRQKRVVPVLEEKAKHAKERNEKHQKALEDIEKLIQSKKEVFAAGKNGLQAYRARAIQSCLWMMLKNSDKKRKFIDASQRAAESQGFAAEWGGRMVRLWVKQWITTRELPSSKRGCHGKVYSLLDDPEICTELRSYLHSNKWSMDPAKLAKFTKDKLIPEEASQYLCQIVEHEMPNGLKQYMELELFPRIQMKVAKGISLSTARRWLVKEGFKYTAHKKALYYDGHERPDVTLYRQETFIPSMKAYDRRLVKYVVGQVENEEPFTCFKVETKLVLCAHDEMTAQANDGQKMSWVWKGEQPLKKKGLGHGLHQSDFICSTVGWLKEASQTLEYGKNYEGYWNGELFVKQVCFSCSFIGLLVHLLI